MIATCVHSMCTVCWLVITWQLYTLSAHVLSNPACLVKDFCCYILHTGLCPVTNSCLLLVLHLLLATLYMLTMQFLRCICCMPAVWTFYYTLTLPLSLLCNSLVYTRAKCQPFFVEPADNRPVCTRLQCLH